MAFFVELLENAHRVSLTGACLAIGEIGSIVTAEYLSDERQGSFFEKFNFRAGWTEHLTKGEIFFGLERPSIQSY